MTYHFDIVEFKPVTLAVTEVVTKQSEIPARIPGMLDTAYAWLGTSGLQAGHNYAVYDRFSPQGMRMQVGFAISARFASTAEVRCVDLAGGRAAHVTHTGPYSGISGATMQLNTWCVQQALELAGVAWEVYGDWQQDETKLITDIYFRLRG